MRAARGEGVRAGYRLLLCDLGVEKRLREQRLVELIVAVPALQRGALCCNVVRYVATWCAMLQHVAGGRSSSLRWCRRVGA